MNKNIFIAKPLIVLSMLLPVVLLEAVILLTEGHHYSIISIVALLYVLAYIYMIVFSVKQFSLKEIILILISIKLIMFASILVSGSLSPVILGTGNDWADFHIPKSLILLEEGMLIESLYSVEGIFNGRLTHVVIGLFSLFLDFVGINGKNIGNIAIMSNMMSFLLLPVIVSMYYYATLSFSNSIKFARRSAFFIALNPFFILSTSFPAKEILLFLAAGFFLLWLLKKQGSITMLVISLVIIAFERVYLIPLLVLFIMFIRGGPFVVVFSALAGVLFVELFIGIEVAYVMYSAHVISLVEVNGSYLPGHGVLSNFIRGGFGPFFLRPFMEEFTTYGALGVSRYLLYLFFGLFFIKSFFYTDGPLKVVLLIYLFIIFLLPFHGTLKLFLLVAFGGIFLDRVSFVHYMKKPPVNKLFGAFLLGKGKKGGI
jgi:hypothetical protein